MNNYYQAVSSFLFEHTPAVVMISSNSMYPFVSEGQQVTIIPLVKPLLHGKCYAYIKNGTITLHRLLAINENSALFIGDSSQKIDDVPLCAVIAEALVVQHDFFRALIHITNSIFCKTARFYPVFKRWRVMVIRAIIKCERLLYERKI